MQRGQLRRENTRKTKNISGAAVLSSHDSFKIDSCFHGKIQNKAHETLCKNQWKQKKTSPMRQNGAALRFELYAW